MRKSLLLCYIACMALYPCGSRRTGAANFSDG
jgi:hypothetical protein